MSDEINLDAGDDAENVVAGKKNTQNSQRNQPSQNMRAGDVYYTGNNELLQVWLKLSDQGRDIQDLDRRMDNLPERVRALENTEVVIRPAALPDARPEVIIRQLSQPESTNLSPRTLLFVLVTALAIVVALVAFLVYWQIAYAA